MTSILRFFISHWPLTSLGMILIFTPVLQYNSRITFERPQVYSTPALEDMYREHILSDRGQRVAKAFRISPDLKKRVFFWFDIYGRYNPYHKVVHHSLYPWIIYDVVDSRSLKKVNSQMRLRLQGLRKRLKTLASKVKKNQPLSENERRLLALFRGATNPTKALVTAATHLRYQSGQKSRVYEGFQRSRPFLKTMETAFESQNLPIELTRLPFVESSFHTKAKSRVGAVGIWQFMKRTGRHFLKINRSVDERLSPIKSTLAAAKLLKQNYRSLYEQWPLAVTAYNYGPTGLRKFVKKFGSYKLQDVIDKNPDRRFSFASSNFYACFLAIVHLHAYRDFVFPSDDPGVDPDVIRYFRITRTVRIHRWLKAAKVSPEIFLSYNPDARQIYLKKGFLKKGFGYYLPFPNRQLAWKRSLKNKTSRDAKSL